ncbi:MAG: hypothetical protein AAF493_18560 [Pseudomonadota bacterium]
MNNWRAPTLIRRALTKTDRGESYWKCVRELQGRGTEEVFGLAADRCRKKDNASRSLGADILGQLGTPDRPFREPSLDVLWRLLSLAKSPLVLNSALVAVGHLQEKSDVRNIHLIASFAKHPSEIVRYGVVHALLARSDPRSITTLVGLSNDEAVMVRDWATFGLGSMVEQDSPRIRRALKDRLDDPDVDTRLEALVGLARRKSSDTRSRLIVELQKPDPTSLVFEAALEFGDASLLPLIEIHRRSADEKTNPDWLSVVSFACEMLSRNGKTNGRR